MSRAASTLWRQSRQVLAKRYKGNPVGLQLRSYVARPIALRFIRPAAGRGLHSQVSFPARVDDGAPVIVLLGWLNSSDKHLAKYSAFYNQHGYITIRIPVKSMPLIERKTHVEEGHQIISLLEQEKFAGRNVVFHVFSNGGCSVFSKVHQLLESGLSFSVSTAVRGTIFDSAPSRRRWSTGILAMTEHIANPFQRRLWQGLVVLRLVAAGIVRQAMALAGHHDRWIYEQLLVVATRRPELYLYSKADRITYYKDVVDFASSRRKLGVDTSEVCWEDSRHVSHMLTHKEEYVRLCLSFVDRCCSAQLGP